MERKKFTEKFNKVLNNTKYKSKTGLTFLKKGLNSNLSIKPDLCYNGINMDTDASISNIVFDNINQSFVIEESYLSYSLSQSPEEIMKVIKTKLYNNNL